MAGREGLVDTAVKTSRSGYLQRWAPWLSRAPLSHWRVGRGSDALLCWLAARPPTLTSLPI